MGRLLALPTSSLYPYPHRHQSATSDRKASSSACFPSSSCPLSSLPAFLQDAALQDNHHDTTATGGDERAEECETTTSSLAPPSTSAISPSPSSSSPPLVGVVDNQIGETRSDDEVHVIWQRAELRLHMITHSLKGTKMPKDRQPFIGEITPFKSPIDEEVTFGIRRLDNAAVMSYRDKDSTVRYIMDDGDAGKIITEKDYPMGTRRLEVVILGLATWNITSGGTPVEINRESILKYLHPEGELDAVYEEIMKLNPILSGNGSARKND